MNRYEYHQARAAIEEELESATTPEAVYEIASRSHAIDRRYNEELNR